jgi:hypothetical protein
VFDGYTYSVTFRAKTVTVYSGTDVVPLAFAEVARLLQSFAGDARPQVPTPWRF